MEKIKKQARRTLQEMVYREWKSAIMSGVYPEGQQLTVRELVELTSTSAMPVREALRRLVAERGLEVLANGRSAVPRLTMRERAITHTARIRLETLATRLAMKKADPDTLQELSELNVSYENAIEKGDWKRALQANRGFHFGLYRLCDSPILISLIESLWLANGPFFADHIHVLIERQWGPERAIHHRAMMAALADQDCDRLVLALRQDMTMINEIEEALGELDNLEF